MISDPQGYYARLGLSPAADPAAIAAAFRQAARRLHPDVPGTGDAEAFVALKAAYDVLSNPVRRAAYDRLAQQPTPTPPLAPPPGAPWPGFGDLPVMVWLGVLGVAVVAVISAVIRLSGGHPNVPASAPMAAQAPAAPAPRITIRLAGPPTHYVTPGNGPATLWEADASGQRLIPLGGLPAFTSVRATGVLAEHGLIIVALADGGHAFVDATRLTPGGVGQARQAFCADQAGAPPGNAEILGQRGAGTSKVVIHNRGEEPTVVKLRDANQATQAVIYVSPGITATVLNLPGGPWQADIAVGEMWSRACRTFAAGMRAQRLPGMVQPGSSLTIPPDLPAGAATTEISEQAFTRD